jgi:hypothetical protein
MARRSTVGLLACLLAVGAVLGGCSKTHEANDTLPSTSAPAPALTEEELPPLGPADLPMPEEARTQDAAGAEAFVRYYIELINRTSTIMDAQPLRQFSDGCRDCDRIASSTEEAAAAGHNYEGGEMTIIEIGPAVMRQGAASLPIVVNQAQFVVLDGSGAATHGGSDAYWNVTGGVGVIWDARLETWLMTDMTFT